MKTIDHYLHAVLDEKQRAALAKLRKAIHAAAPTAEEGFSYGLPAFRVNGEAIAAFAACAKYNSYYPMSGQIVGKLQEDLKAYTTSKGAIQFPIHKSLPAALVKKLVRARLALKKKESGKTLALTI